MNKKILIILIALCLVGLVLGLMLIRQGRAPVVEEVPPLGVKKIHPLCVGFGSAEEKNSCQQAIDAVLMKYPGKVYAIEKAEYKGEAGWKVEVKTEKGEKIPQMLSIAGKESSPYVVDEYEIYVIDNEIKEKGVSQKEVEQIVKYTLGHWTFSDLKMEKTEKDVSTFGQEPNIREVWEVKILFPEEKEIKFMDKTVSIKGYEIFIDYQTGEILRYTPIGSEYGQKY